MASSSSARLSHSHYAAAQLRSLSLLGTCGTDPHLEPVDFNEVVHMAHAAPAGRVRLIGAVCCSLSIQTVNSPSDFHIRIVTGRARNAEAGRA